MTRPYIDGKPPMKRWKVLWRNQEGQKKFRRFQGDKPTEAVQFAKELKRQGLKPNVISSSHAFPPTREQEEKRRPGQIWCPYCLRWRSFKLMVLKRATYETDALMRCPVCTISTNDFFVKKYNDFLEHMSEDDLIKKLTRYEAANG